MKKASISRILALALVLAMVLSMMPAAALAAAASDVTVSGAADVVTTVVGSDIPAGFRAYCAYDIQYSQADKVSVTVQVDSSFDAALPALVMDPVTGRVETVTVENGAVTFTAGHSCTYILAQAEVAEESASTSVYTLTQVMDAGELVTGVPYVIADYAKQWVLTNKAATVSGTTYTGLQLEGTPSGNTAALWYMNSDGHLVYGSANSTNYLMVGLSTPTTPYTAVGALTDTNADDRCIVVSDATSPKNLIIKNVAGNGFLNRWGGKDTDTVATRYSSVGGSFWHMYRRDTAVVELTAVPSMSNLPVRATAQISADVTLASKTAQSYTVSWTSSDPEIATVTAEGLVMPVAPGCFTVIGELTEVNGITLTRPLLLHIPMSAYDTVRTVNTVTATGSTVATSELSADLAVGTASGPYIISNPSVTPTSYLSGNGPVTSKHCTGLELITWKDGNHLWYYDGTYLRFGAADGPYLAYENGQVALSTDPANAFDDIYRYVYNDSAYNAYIIHNSHVTGSNYNCLNQLGGAGYYAAGLFTAYAGSRWEFHRVQPGREVTLRVTPRTSTVSLGSKLTLVPQVKLEGTSTSDYTIHWASSNTAVATVSGGVVTPKAMGTTVITVTVTKAGGQDTFLSLELPLTVVTSTVSGNTARVEATLPTVWQRVTDALPTDSITGPYRIANRSSGFAITGKQGVTSAICTAGGLGLAAAVEGDRSDLWYYDGTGLLYGDPTATHRYMVYENNQIGLGSDTGMNFNDITLTKSFAPSFNIANAKLTTKRYANQLGGGTYDALGVWSQDGDATAGSGWYFYTPGPARQVSLSMTASKTELMPDEQAVLTSAVSLDGITLSSSAYTMTYTSSNPAVATVTGGVVMPQQAGTTTVTATLTTLNSGKPDALLTVQLPITVHGIQSASLNTKSGTVMADAAADTAVGPVLTVTYTNGTSKQVPVTLAHLTDASGNGVSTATAGTFSNLKVVYDGSAVCTDFTLTVRDGIPANGSVYADKSVTGVNFFSTRVAQVELKVGGINGESGNTAGTAAYLLDTVGSDFTLLTATTGRITPTVELVRYPLYSLADYEAGACTLTQVGTRKGSAETVEKITFSADGTGAYSSITGSSTNILSNGVISATSFWYNSNATAAFVSDNGTTRTIPSKTLRWKVGTLSDCELVLRYYVAIEKGKEAGTYPVGRYTDLYYTDPASASQRIFTASPTIYYEQGEEEIIIPTLNPAYASLSFEDEVLYNVYFTVTDQGSVTLADMGMITFDTKLTDGTVANCTGKYAGAVSKDGMLMVQSGGIPAKKLGDTLYFKIYAQLPDGTYVYSNILGYSARQYAKTQLAGNNLELKRLVVAMVTYGAAAQYTFNYNTGNLLNSILTAEDRALVSSYNATMVPSTSVDSSKTGSFSSKVGFSKKYATVSFESAFALNYYFTPDSTPDGNVTMYYWSQADYRNASTLTTANATRTITMTKTATGEYTAEIAGIAAKELGDAVYVAVVCTSGGQSYCSGVIGYSVGVYCKSFAGDSSSNMYIIGKATIVYGYYAKAYFDSLK